MALQHNITTDSGLNVQNAYSRVESILLLNKSKVKFTLFSYANKEEGIPFNKQTYMCDYDIESYNPIKQAYLYLKTLSEFSNTTDV
jgi:hypothetical protein